MLEVTPPPVPTSEKSVLVITEKFFEDEAKEVSFICLIVGKDEQESPVENFMTLP